MQSNQQYKNLAADALANMRAAMAAGSARWGAVAAKANYREPLPGERVGKADLPGWLLTPAQAQGIAMQQELCHQLIDLLAKMNENAVVYELPLPLMATVAAAERLLQVDDVVKKCRFAAAKLGIEPVQAKLKFTLYEARAPKRAQQPKAA